MLSYQHIYHAGGPADIHKHSVLCAVLEQMRRRYPALTYMETHAGRGLYDLHAAEAVKTGEAAQGWLRAGASAKVPPQLATIIRDMNGGADTPLYPGSPMVASRMLRKSDKLHLCELHPQEHKALAEALEQETTVNIYQKDGYETVLALSPPLPRRGVVLIDPSYEIKNEYGQVPPFIVRLCRRWPEVVVLLWYPLLPAARHKEMKEQIAKTHKGGVLSEYCWAAPEGQSGMYGSGMIMLNTPFDLPGFTSL